MSARPDIQINLVERPKGSNADEWHLFLSTYLDSRAGFCTGMEFIAVQIAEAIEEEREACAKIADHLEELVSNSIQSGKGEHGKTGYVRDSIWDSWHGQRQMAEVIGRAIRERT